MAKKDKKTRLRNEADKLWSELVKRSGFCEKCGDTTYLAAHHIIYKSQSNFLRCDPNNGITLCRGCHFWIHHESPTVVSDFLTEKLGEETIRYLNSRRRTLVKANSTFWEERISILKDDTSSESRKPRQTFLAG